MSYKFRVVSGFSHVEVKPPQGGHFVVNPGDNLSTLPAAVRDYCHSVHTPDVVLAYQKYREELAKRDVTERRVGTPREFLRLFEDQEKAAFFTAKKTNVQLELWWAEASTGDFSLDHPTVALGLAGLVQAGILTQARANEIQGADFNA